MLKFTVLQVTKLPLYAEQHNVNNIRHYLLYKA